MNVSVLGAYKSRLRGEIEEAIQIKAESLIDLVDYTDLLAHIEEFMGVVFYEYGIEEGQPDGRKETRVVVNIKWDHIWKHWVALSLTATGL